MLGPDFSPIVVVLVNVVFFVGIGALAYLFGSKDSRSSQRGTGL